MLTHKATVLVPDDCDTRLRIEHIDGQRAVYVYSKARSVSELVAVLTAEELKNYSEMFAHAAQLLK